MITLILLVVLGLGMAYFATQNLASVPLSLGGGFAFMELPLYILAIGFMILGLLVGWLVSAVGRFSTARTIQGKDTLIQDARRRIDEILEENRSLHLQIESLKKDYEARLLEEKQRYLYEAEDIERQKLKEQVQPSFLDRLKHSFG